MSPAASHPFGSLRSFNYRVWVGGSFVSNVGTWMQRIAQDWLVLTQLTHHDAAAVGVVVALQNAPVVLLLPASGFAADHLDRRKVLIATQALMGALALALGLLTVAGTVRLWHVYVFALLFGAVAAIDTPVRQAFGPELVGDAQLSNAISLNSASFNLARMVGPAVAGVLIGSLGSGAAFLVNAASFAAVLGSLAVLRTGELHPQARAVRAPGSFVAGLRYVWVRPDLRAVTLMIFLIGTFGLNFALLISTMAVSAFHVGAVQYGLLTSIMAVGTVSGAIFTARRGAPDMVFLMASAAVLGLGFLLAALSPGYGFFAAALVVVGVASLAFTTSTSSFMQLGSLPEMRGRVISLRIAVAMGATPLGAPLLGWVANALGSRWAVGLAGGSAFAGALVALRFLIVHQRLRMRREGGQLRLAMEARALFPDAPSRLVDGEQTELAP